MSQLDVADQAFDAAAAPEAQGSAAKTRQAKWKAAAGAYAAFLKAAGPGHRLGGYALHRHIRSLWNAEEADAALAELLALFQHLKANPSAPGAKELGALARADLAPLYADSTRQPADAGAWLAGVAQSTEETTQWLEAMGEAYLAVARYKDARAVFAGLQAAHPGASACVYSARSLAVSIVQNPADRKRLMVAVHELLALRKSVEQSAAAAADKERCRAATLAPIVELVSAWRTEAVGSNGRVGSKDFRTMTAVAELLRALSDDFTTEELDATPLQEVPAPNRPSRSRVGLALAQLGQRMHRYGQCADDYERAYDPVASVALQAAATQGAVDCHAELLRSPGWLDPARRSEGLENSEIAAALDRFPKLASRYLCLVEPAETDPAGVSRRLEVELLRGRIEFLVQRWERAAGALAQLAFKQGHSQGREAAAMYAIALHKLHGGGNAACGADLSRVKNRLKELHCSVSSGDEELAYLALPGVTTRGPSTGLTPCEALLAVGAPPAPRVAPPPRAPPTTPIFRADSTSVAGSGNVVPEVVAWVLDLHAAQLRACYAATLRRDPFFEPLRGNVTLSFTVGRDGTVFGATTTFRGFPNSHLSSCLAQVVYVTKFAEPEGGLAHVGISADLGLERGVRLRPRLRLWQSLD